MSVIRRPTVRPFLIVAAAAAVFVAGAATASGKARSSAGQPTVALGAPATTGVGVAPAGVAVAAPARVSSTFPELATTPWCCSSAPGVTSTGQATVHGQGPAARNQAIARAVADATAQAQSAASAAHITLGAIVDMQVSAPPNVYPVAMGSASGGTDPSGPTPVPAETFASVTITWAIA
jgi:hypothetical protein